MNKILVAGATGYLGKYAVKEFKKQGYWIRALARNASKLDSLAEYIDEKFIGEITDSNSMSGICKDMDIVFSSIGITKQKDGLSYMDVDYQANINLLDEAKKNGVKKFIYVSVLNGDRLKKLKICEAKEKFVDELKLSGLDYCIIRPNGFFSDMSEFLKMARKGKVYLFGDELKNSGLDYCIIRPNGFFSDMSEFLKMARKGKVYLFGDGNQKANPIHGEDLAKVCVSAIESNEKEIEVGGPETLTHNEIAELAFSAVGKETKVFHIPDFFRRLTLKVGKIFMSSKNFGPMEFFMNVMAIDMVAPKYGNHQLQNFFMDCKDKI